MACIVAVSNRCLFKSQVSHRAVQVILFHKLQHSSVTVDLIVCQDDRMRRHRPTININALTKVRCNARPMEANSTLYIQSRACFVKHIAINRSRVQSPCSQRDLPLAPKDFGELALSFALPRGLRVRRDCVDLYTFCPRQLVLQISKLTVKIFGLLPSDRACSKDFKMTANWAAILVLCWPWLCCSMLFEY